MIKLARKWKKPGTPSEEYGIVKFRIHKIECSEPLVGKKMITIWIIKKENIGELLEEGNFYNEVPRGSVHDRLRNYLIKKKYITHKQDIELNRLSKTNGYYKLGVMVIDEYEESGFLNYFDIFGKKTKYKKKEHSLEGINDFLEALEKKVRTIVADNIEKLTNEISDVAATGLKIVIDEYLKSLYKTAIEKKGVDVATKVAITNEELETLINKIVTYIVNSRIKKITEIIRSIETELIANETFQFRKIKSEDINEQILKYFSKSTVEVEKKFGEAIDDLIKS